MQIKDKSFIVTGGAGGIGKALIKKLLEAKAIVASVDINKDKLEELQNEFNKYPGKLVIYAGDVSNLSSVKKIVNDFSEKFGEINCLINNAAILNDSPLISIFQGELKKHPISNWEKTISTNLTGVFSLVSRLTRTTCPLATSLGPISNLIGTPLTSHSLNLCPGV